MLDQKIFKGERGKARHPHPKAEAAEGRLSSVVNESDLIWRVAVRLPGGHEVAVRWGCPERARMSTSESRGRVETARRRAHGWRPRGFKVQSSSEESSAIGYAGGSAAMDDAKILKMPVRFY